MVPDFRRDDVWTPAFAGVTIEETSCVIIKFFLPGFYQPSVYPSQETPVKKKIPALLHFYFFF